MSYARKELRAANLISAPPDDHRSGRRMELPPPPDDEPAPQTTEEIIDKLQRQAKDAPEGLDDDPDKAGDAFLDSITEVAGRDLDAPEMKRILARIARHWKTPPQIRVAAVMAKAKLDEQQADRNQLGPGPPLTREDAIVRLTLLFQACGLDIVTAAMERAFAITEDNSDLDPVPPLSGTQEGPQPDGRDAANPAHPG